MCSSASARSSGNAIVISRNPRGRARRMAVPAPLRSSFAVSDFALPSPITRRRSALSPSGRRRSSGSATVALNSPVPNHGAAAAATASDVVSSAGEGGSSLPVAISTAKTTSRGVTKPAGSWNRAWRSSALILTRRSICDLQRRWLRAIAARASLSASRFRSVSRLSHCCLPVATASSHLTRPFRK